MTCEPLVGNDPRVTLLMVPVHFTRTCVFTHVLTTQKSCTMDRDLVYEFHKEFLLGDKNTARQKAIIMICVPVRDVLSSLLLQEGCLNA